MEEVKGQKTMEKPKTETNRYQMNRGGVYCLMQNHSNYAAYGTKEKRDVSLNLKKRQGTETRETVFEVRDIHEETISNKRRRVWRGWGQRARQVT